MKRGLLAVAVIVCSTALMVGQARPSIEEALKQLRAGDPFRAVLTLNEVVSQNPADAPTVARAQAVRAMAFLALKQPERAKSATDLALKADPNYVPAAADVDADTIALFKAALAPAPANSEAAGAAAEKAGRHQDAFLAYLAAYQALPLPTPVSDERRLRERIIRVVGHLSTTPIVPQAARDHARKADQLLEAEAVLGSTGGASSRTAEAELLQALRIAPWWPDATFKLASVQQRMQRVDEALANLNLYKLANPQGAPLSTPAPNTAATPRAVAATAAASVPQPAGRGTIVVVRAWNYIASANRVDIDCNGVRLAELQNGRMFRFTAPAGTVTLKFKGDDALELQVEPGGEYYFRSSPGGLGFNTRQLTKDEGASYLKERKPKPNDAKRTMSTECGAATRR